jgi:hypothetical protein
MTMRTILESLALWPNKVVDYKREESTTGNRDGKLVFLSKERDFAVSITTNRSRYSVTERVQGSWHL